MGVPRLAWRNVAQTRRENEHLATRVEPWVSDGRLVSQTFATPVSYSRAARSAYWQLSSSSVCMTLTVSGSSNWATTSSAMHVASK